MSPTQSIVVDSRLPCLSRQRIAMSVQGKGDPLLLVNGLSRPMQSWGPFSSELKGRTVVSFDAPGVGGSPTPIRPLSIAELATLAVAVLDAAGLAEADVLGYSHGGAVAQQMAHDAPERVSGLILASTSCGLGATPGNTTDIIRHLGSSLDGKPWPLPDPLGMLWQTLAVSNWSSIPFLGSIAAPADDERGSLDRAKERDARPVRDRQCLPQQAQRVGKRPGLAVKGAAKVANDVCGVTRCCPQAARG